MRKLFLATLLAVFFGSAIAQNIELTPVFGYTVAGLIIRLEN